MKVLIREELYSGPQLHKLPDILFSVDDYTYEASPTFEDVPYVLPHNVPRRWHREEAIFIAYGADIMRGREIEECVIYDIAPTILHLMGVPVPRDMDGKVLKDIFQKDSNVARREITYQAAEDNREQIKRKLKHLKKPGQYKEQSQMY